MTDNPTNNNESAHPDWCVADVDGWHTAEFGEPRQKEGYNIYTRPLDFGDGEVGLEVVVAEEDGTRVTRVEIDPSRVTEAAQLAEFRELVAGLGDDPDEETA